MPTDSDFLVPIKVMSSAAEGAEEEEVKLPIKLMSTSPDFASAASSPPPPLLKQDSEDLKGSYENAWGGSGPMEKNVFDTPSLREDSSAGTLPYHAPRASVRIRRNSTTQQQAAKKKIHILDRPDLSDRALLTTSLKVQLPTERFFRKKMIWKSRFIFLDRSLGILIFKNQDAFNTRNKDDCVILRYRDISNVTKEDVMFTLFIKRKVQHAFGAFVQCLVDSVELCEDLVSLLTRKIQVFARVYTVGINGEFPENAHCNVRPHVAVCFSGGGGRAHVCASGQLRALHHLGLLVNTKVDYLTGVSAGAWATSIYTFFQEGAETDSELLGPLYSSSLDTLTMEELHTNPLPPILRPCLENAMNVASKLLIQVNPHELWEHVLGKIFLEPFGLNHAYPYSVGGNALVDLREKNPQLEHVHFFTPRNESRPFWMCSGVIVGPNWAKLGNLLTIQFSTLYVGSPYLHKMHYSSAKQPRRRRRSSILRDPKSTDIWVGGGMVSSFVFGGDEPLSLKQPKSTNNSGYFRLFKSSSKQLTASPSSTSEDFTKTTTKTMPPKMASLVFAEMMRKNIPLPVPHLNEVEEAMDTLNLGPQMIERVFKHAQQAITKVVDKTHHRRSLSASSGPLVSEGVFSKEVMLPYPECPFSLRHTLGISSDAPSVNLHEKSLFNSLNTQVNYWSPVYSPRDESVAEVDHQEEPVLDTTRQIKMDMGDGGSLDNLGLCAMLQRKVRRIVCFCNSSNCVPSPRTTEPNEHLKRHTRHLGAVRKLSVEERLGVVDEDRPPTYEEWMDDDILPLFGQDVDNKALAAIGSHHYHNHVFPLEELRPLLRAFQAKLILGEPIVVKQTHQVLENSFWGIESGWEVEILWVYLDESANFNKQLPEDTREELEKVDRGEFARFPNFRTFGNNKALSFDIRLTARQVSLLSTFTEYQVMSNKDLFTEFLDSENMPVLPRQRRQRDATVNQLETEGFC